MKLNLSGRRPSPRLVEDGIMQNRKNASAIYLTNCAPADCRAKPTLWLSMYPRLFRAKRASGNGGSRRRTEKSQRINFADSTNPRVEFFSARFSKRRRLFKHLLSTCTVRAKSATFCAFFVWLD